ncbi:MAG: DUF3306 domain-containing protein [Geminicoccales bacterium]
MAEEEGFVGRWSRLKHEARRRRPEPPARSEQGGPPEPSEGATSEPAGSRAPAGVADAEAFDPASLPDIESLTYESDYTAFLEKGVPAEMRNRALRRLWRSDPVLANLDGLVEYGEDYSGIGTKPMIVRTAYRVGRGMIDRVLEADGRDPEPTGPVPPDGAAPQAQGSVEADHKPATEATIEAEKEADGAPEAQAEAADPPDATRRPAGS